MITVTKPDLPKITEFFSLLESIWRSGILTNCGPLHQELEDKLRQYLGVPYLSLFCNGTNALISAIQSLNLSGEVITTPFSFAATSHAVKWNSLTPVFADIDPVSLNLNPIAAEKLISEKTSAILPVHCYGVPADVEAFERLAKKYGLKLIYDAAHCFNPASRNLGVLNRGDLSILSFHATKTFNTFEGGAVISHSAEMKARIDKLRNFGISDNVEEFEVGTNGKMSELAAAAGLLQLEMVDKLISARKLVAERYLSAFEKLDGVRCHRPADEATYNNGYFPILVSSPYPLSRDELLLRLKNHGVVARRYFYPLLSDIPAYRNAKSKSLDDLAVAKNASNSILCLPIYPKLSLAEQKMIIDVVCLNKR